MNIHPTVISALRYLARLATLGASLALAACGTNWQDAPAYVKVGGIVNGLTGTLVLCQGSACSSTPPGGDPLTVTSNGPFSFALQVANGSPYVVSVRQQPQNQTCTIANASGGTNEHTSVTVTCRSNATIGGTITGLTGAIVLENNGGNALATATNGPFTFTQSIASGAAYLVTVQTQPPGEFCTVGNGAGTATANVATVVVSCAPAATLGGTVAGLVNGGKVVLLDSAGESLPVTADGPFTFNGGVGTGATYTVTVQTPPAGEVCWVANDNGTVTGNVSNIAVTCQAPVAFALRPLPANLSTLKAVNYGPARGCGPPCQEITPVADIEQDLGVLEGAGFTLLKLFGAARPGEPLNNLILQQALQNHPNLKFNLGNYLIGPNEQPGCLNNATTANQVKNALLIDALIALANSYPNVVMVTIGNETSLARNQDVKCLAHYIQTVRTFVTQPVSADDTAFFWAGQSAGNNNNFGDPNYVASPELPDSLFPLVDFVSIHYYPDQEAGTPVWPNAAWQQLGVAAGPARAAAMMNSALAAIQTGFGQVQQYMAGHGGSAQPIVIGETGWRSYPAQPTSAIDVCCSSPVNQKMYYDLMSSWSGSAGGPASVFWFEAFEEAWKGSDGGYGIWDIDRNPLYALCGTTALNAPACTNPVYQGASYFQ